MIQSVYRDAYLFDSEAYTKEMCKDIKFSFVGTHNLAYKWKKNKEKWVIHKSKTSGYFRIKSIFREGYLYASERPTGYMYKGQFRTMYACGHPLPDAFKNPEKANWKIIKVQQGNGGADVSSPPPYNTLM